MNRTTWKMTSPILIMTLILLGGVEAQQHQQHHRGGAQASPTQTDKETKEAPAQAPMQGMMQQMQGMMQQMQGMMQQMHGQMGQGGMMGHSMMRERADDEPLDDPGMIDHSMMDHIQRSIDRLTQQLDLSDEQQMKVQDLLRIHAKEGIRLKADIDMASIDLQQLLDAQPVDMDRVKTTLQTIAAKEADLRLTHLAAMQDIQNLLTPEQQKLFRSLRGHMMDGGGKMSRGGLQHGKSGH